MKKSKQTAFQPPPQYGQSLRGLSVNLLSGNLPRAAEFQRSVLQVTLLHEDPDLLILQGFGSQWMIHADHTYDKHPLLSDTLSQPRRGSGAEIRLHGCDPDKAAQRAIDHGFRVLDGPRDQADHGLREAHLIDDDGYVWVPDVSLVD